jgi:hypothetical protein
MKRTAIVLALLVIAAVGLAAETSAFYPVRVDVVKVYTHGEGFLVIYRKGSTEVGQCYLPAKWFVSGGKGELVRGEDSSLPYMSIFYKDGKFDHLRLYVKADSRDTMWGVLSPQDGAGKFNFDDLKIEY